MLKLIDAFYESGHSELTVDFKNNSRLRSRTYQEWFGSIVTINQPEVAPFYQVEILVFGPSETLPYYRYVTQGMSDYPMNKLAPMSALPNKSTQMPDRIELMLYSRQGPDENNGASSRYKIKWQFNLLRKLARVPFLANSRLKAEYACLPFFSDQEPILPEFPMSNCFFYPPVHETACVRSGIELTQDQCHLYIVDFLSDAEMAYKQERGDQAIFDLFDANNHFPVIERKSYL